MLAPSPLRPEARGIGPGAAPAGRELLRLLLAILFVVGVLGAAFLLAAVLDIR